MTTTKKYKKQKPVNVKAELKKVELLLAELHNDKSLPTFVEHVFQCIAFGTSEQVNLKAMYPKLHGKISKWVAMHNRRIITLQKVPKS